MSCLGREAHSVDGTCHEAVCFVRLDSRPHPRDYKRRKESSAGQAEDVSNNAYEEGQNRGHLRRVSRPHSRYHDHEGS